LRHPTRVRAGVSAALLWGAEDCGPD